MADLLPIPSEFSQKRGSKRQDFETIIHFRCQIVFLHCIVLVDLKHSHKKLFNYKFCKKSTANFQLWGKLLILHWFFLLQYFLTFSVSIHSLREDKNKYFLLIFFYTCKGDWKVQQNSKTFIFLWAN